MNNIVINLLVLSSNNINKILIKFFNLNSQKIEKEIQLYKKNQVK